MKNLYLNNTSVLHLSFYFLILTIPRSDTLRLLDVYILEYNDLLDTQKNTTVRVPKEQKTKNCVSLWMIFARKMRMKSDQYALFIEIIELV